MPCPDLRAQQPHRQQRQRRQAPGAFAQGQHEGQRQRDPGGQRELPSPGARVQRAPVLQRPGRLRQQVLDQPVHFAGFRHRHQVAHRTLVVHRLDRGAVHAQAAASEPAVGEAFAQAPGLDAPARHVGAHAGQQATLHAQPPSRLGQGETVELQQGQQHRQQPQRDHRHQQQAQGAGQPADDAQVQVLAPAHQRLDPGFDGNAGQLETRLRQYTERGRDQDHAAVGDQAQLHHLGRRQRQQHGVLAGRRARDGVLAAPAHQGFQGQRILQLQHPHLGLGPGAAGRLQPHFGDTEHAMQHRLLHRHVVDPRERDLAPAAVQPAAADGDRVGADLVAVGEVLQHREQHQHADADQRPQFVPVALPEHQQRQQRHDELLELLQQHEQPRPRVQPALAGVGGDGVRGRHRRCRTGARGGRAALRRRRRRVPTATPRRTCCRRCAPPASPAASAVPAARASGRRAARG